MLYVHVCSWLIFDVSATLKIQIKSLQQTFENIYHETFPVLSRFLFLKTNHYEDTQDLLQELYLSFYQHLQKSKEPIESPQAYLLKMAQNLLSRYYLHKSKTNLNQDYTLDTELVPEDFELESVILDKLESESIWASIQSLKEPDRSLLIARFHFEMSYPELSRQFELPETTIKSKIYTALKHLQKKFSK